MKINRPPVPARKGRAFSDIDHVITEKGSVYRYLPNGMTQRFKTAEGRLSPPKDILVYVPDFESLLRMESIDRPGNTEDEYYASLLDHVHDRSKWIRVANRDGRSFRTNHEIVADGGPIWIAFGEGESLSFCLPAFHLPKEGYLAYDVKYEADNTCRRHLGHKVTQVVFKP